MPATAPIILPIKTPGIRQLEKLERQMQSLEKDIDKVAVKTPKATNQIKRFGDQAKKTESKVSGLTKSLRGFLTAAALLGTAKFIIGKTAELETQTRSLKVLTGELETAQRIVLELQSFAAVTPFTSSELIESAKRLKAFGVDTEKLVDTTQRLADVSGATGARLNEVATAYGQIQAKGRLQGEELLQLQERGIALQDELQKMYGLTGQEFSKALQKGQFSAEAVEGALQRLTTAGGKYADGAISQSDTLAGKFSTLIDGIENIARTLGNVLSPALKTILNEAIGVINSINAALAAGRRIQQFGIGAEERGRLFRQAGQEAQQLAELRGGGVIDPAEFTRLRDERFRDLIERFGFETGQIEVEIKPVVEENTIPELLGGNSKTGGGSGKSAADEAERQAEAISKGLVESQKALAIAQQELKVAEAGTELRRLEEELTLKKLEINQQFNQLYADALSDQQRMNIELTRELELRKASLDSMGQMQQAAQNDFQSFFKKQPEYQKLFNDELTETEELLKGSYEIIAGELTGAIEGLVKGTADWGDVLSNILSQLGSMFLNAGTQGLGNALFPGLGFADGGRPPVDRPSIVGERGPELFVPDTAGTVVSNADTRATLDRYSGNNETSSYSSSLNITTGPVMQMNNDQYIRRADFERGLRQAAQDGAKQGEAMTLRRLKNSRSTRAQLGM